MPILKYELDALLPKKFVDRDELFELITSSLSWLQNDSNYFDVISIHGIGGIGKSRFLEELKEHVAGTSENIEFIYTTLEVENDDAFHALLRIRKNISHSCYLYDYALIALIDSCTVERINDDFLNILKENLITGLLSLAQEIIPIPTMGINSTIETLNLLISKLKTTYTERKYWDVIQSLKRIAATSPKKLFSLLPSLLGCDLDRIARSKNLAIIIDSCSETKYGSSWIDSLLSSVGHGVFILTSRERLHLQWKNTKHYHMQEIPPL